MRDWRVSIQTHQLDVRTDTLERWLGTDLTQPQHVEAAFSIAGVTEPAVPTACARVKRRRPDGGSWKWSDIRIFT